jgi:hypothetical protein
MSNECQNPRIKVPSKNIIPAKAGIQRLLVILDSRLRGSDKLVIIRGILKSLAFEFWI